MNRKAYAEAWRHCRMMNLGTLNCSFPRALAIHIMDAHNKRNATMYTASAFYAYGYYKQGLKRL